jgi:hypothetical protein
MEGSVHEDAPLVLYIPEGQQACHEQQACDEEGRAHQSIHLHSPVVTFFPRMLVSHVTQQSPCPKRHV